MKVAAFVGWAAIVAGLCLEQFAGNKVKNLDTSIQECSDAKVQAAILEAGDAATSATTAHKEAGGAATAARDAKDEAAALL